jgi:hypothetical protein
MERSEYEKRNLSSSYETDPVKTKSLMLIITELCLLLQTGVTSDLQIFLQTDQVK